MMFIYTVVGHQWAYGNQVFSLGSFMLEDQALKAAEVDATNQHNKTYIGRTYREYENIEWFDDIENTKRGHKENLGRTYYVMRNWIEPVAEVERVAMDVLSGDPQAIDLALDILARGG
jgi:hypothetical protein